MAEHIPVLVGVARTPTGKFLGSLASLSAPRLGAIAIQEAVLRAGIEPQAIEEVIMGNVVSAGIGQAPARAGSYSCRATRCNPGGDGLIRYAALA